MSTEFLPKRDRFRGSVIQEWMLTEEVGRGKNGVVYRCEKAVEREIIAAAVKIIPAENLKPAWPEEIRKTLRLQGILEIIQYREHAAVLLDDRPFVCIWWGYVDGENLRDYVKAHRRTITLAFVENLIRTVLRAFVAMSETSVSHGDLHEGNILIAKPDRRHYEQIPVIKVGDFGIGGSHNFLRPKDDYVQLASICHFVLRECIDPAGLGDSREKAFFRFLVDDFLPKQVLETNPSVGEFVRSPRVLLAGFDRTSASLRGDTLQRAGVPLRTPFDYLSCEQIGDSFELLQTLYSSNFPGYEDLLQPANTVLTGPRGCGKTTVLKNLSLKTQLLGRKHRLPEGGTFVGVYYHCGDLFFPFHYMRERARETDRKLLRHYFNLALLREIIDTFAVAAEIEPDMVGSGLTAKIEGALTTWFRSYEAPPAGTPILRHLLGFIDGLKNAAGLLLRKGKRVLPSVDLLPLDFIPELCAALREAGPFLKNRPFYFFLDDYSLPHISQPMQATLHDVILYRWPACFFKVSTESIATFYPQDSTGKLIEETREYDVIDLGAFFMQVETLRKAFLIDIINNRLKHASVINPRYSDIRDVLGPAPYDSYNALARQIRGGDSIHYAGVGTIADLFSGDIADLLRLVRSIFLAVGPYETFSGLGVETPIRREKQDKAIREYCAGFLDRVQAAPGSGSRLRRIAEAFGRAANWTLKHQTSKNVNGNPPKQAFRIEIRDSFSFDDSEAMADVFRRLVDEAKQKTTTVENFVALVRSTYNDLLKYGVFLRDVRGKSQRGAVVPRLYLRRLLIPTFVLTPSQRDNIGLESHEFIELLYKPERFVKLIQDKARRGSERQQSHGAHQGKLPY
jgi:predicted Ser/Thr protein kinase